MGKCFFVKVNKMKLCPTTWKLCVCIFVTYLIIYTFFWVAKLQTEQIRTNLQLTLHINYGVLIFWIIAVIVNNYFCNHMANVIFGMCCIILMTAIVLCAFYKGPTLLIKLKSVVPFFTSTYKNV